MRLRQPFYSVDENGNSQGWGTFLAGNISDDDQPVTESELDTDDETEYEESSEEVETDEEPEDEDEQEESSEEETEEIDEPEQPLFNDDTEIELGEGRQAIKLSELKAGYLRQSDYTKKTQELASQRKEVESLQDKVKPAQEWLDTMERYPWMAQQINQAFEHFNQTGTLPLEEVLDGSEYGKYINHLMYENNRLTKELETTKGEYEGVKLSADMTRLSHDLKGEYGDLVTEDYMQQLQERGKNEKLSMETLREIADGKLAKQRFETNKTEVKKATKAAESKTIQKMQETRKTAPQAPSKTSSVPSKAKDTGNGSWGDFFKSRIE